MSQRRKVIIFIVVFLALTSAFWGWSFMKFFALRQSYDELTEEAVADIRTDRLNDAMSSFKLATSRCAAASQTSCGEDYSAAYSALVGALSDWIKYNSHSRVVTDVQRNVMRYLEISNELIAAPAGGGFSDIAGYLERLETETRALLLTNHLERMDAIAIGSKPGLAEDRQVEAVAFFVVASASIILSALLLIVLRRMIEEPYRALLLATEKVSSGDFTYRINSVRGDEFGTIAKRFDAMAAGLESSERTMLRRIRETELMLAMMRMSDLGSGLANILRSMVDEITAKLSIGGAAILLYGKQSGAFTVEAATADIDDAQDTIARDSAFSNAVKAAYNPVVLADADSRRDVAGICPGAEYVMAVPVRREGELSGALVLWNTSRFEADPEAAMILAQTIANTLRNHELLDETRTQLSQLSATHELTKAITTLYDEKELLTTIASRLATLLRARGCVIRMLEGDMLVIKSYAGEVKQEMFDVPVPLGKGVAGIVAESGKPLCIDDISALPEHMRYSASPASAVIAVPLKRDVKIIGTVALYDKLAPSGKVVPFSPGDMAIVEGFAYIAAIAIEKTRMHEREKRIEIEKLKTERRMELLFESVQSGIITLDRTFTIMTANKYIERWIDRPLSEILLMDAREVFHSRQGICPHCAAVATFEDGSINTITQSHGLNYADLSSYPVRDENGDVVEAVVFIQDITDRILYQEEIMGLYREVMQTKEYMEGLIGNSADAIVTTDMEGIVKSWNPAADEIYGFGKDEVLGKFVPYVADGGMPRERQHIETIRRGEVVKDEGFRKRKDGTEIEVSVTLSPIKDVSGEIIGISSISRDVTDKKRVEKQLIRRNQELSRLFFISSAMRGSLDLDKVLKMVLTAVTMSDGLGFNRAILFLLDDDGQSLSATMGVGPASAEDAGRIWKDLESHKKTLHDYMNEIESSHTVENTMLERLGPLVIPIDSETMIARTARERLPLSVEDARKEFPGDSVLARLESRACASVPLVARGKIIGVLWVDNLFSRKPVVSEDMNFLAGFADQVSSAIEAARLFRKVSLAEAELENIFSSITDLVYFTGKDYTIRNVNQAVVEKIGLPREQIVGRKCYQIFHGKDEPWHECPHSKTMTDLKPHIQEVEDPYLKGTFITSTAPMFGAGGEFMGTVHVVREITEIKELRNRLQSAERMAALGEVAAKVAHEIRNPLVSVGGFAKRLERKLDGGLKEYAWIITEEVGRLELILKDILSFVRDVRMHQRDVDFKEVVNGVLDLTEPEFELRGNRLVRDMDSAEVPMFIDPDRVREAVLNIIVNANHFTEHGVVKVSVRSEGGYGVLVVDDTGSGIRDEDVRRIFDPFFTTRTTGTGLGLAVAKRIVEENDGSIDVEVKGAGIGTVFRIKLPYKGGNA